MTNRLKFPKPCIGLVDKGCPHQASIWTRTAQRCHSCAAVMRLRVWDNSDQLDAARANSPNHLLKGAHHE